MDPPLPLPDLILHLFYHLLKLKLNSVALVRERNVPTERPPLLGEVSVKFADKGCRVVIATDSHGR
jgi:hypothetical protein